MGYHRDHDHALDTPFVLKYYKKIVQTRMTKRKESIERLLGGKVSLDELDAQVINELGILGKSLGVSEAKLRVALALFQLTK